MSELFDIRITEKGKTHLLKLVKVIKWVFFSGILLAASQLAFIIYLNKDLFIKKAFVGHYSRQQQVSLTWDIVSFIIFLWQISIYFKFSKNIRRALLVNNEETFNDSFRFFTKYAFVGLAGVVFALFYYVYFFVEFFWLKV